MHTATHETLGEVRYSVRDLGSWPDDQVSRTVSVMRQRAAQDAADPWFRQRASGILGLGGELDKVASAHAHTRNSIRFQQDEDSGSGIRGLGYPAEEIVEVIVRPLDMARYIDQAKAIGDCDDFSMYAAALLESQGIPCGFVTVAADPRDPSQYSHVYVVAYPRDEFGRRVRVPIDASHGDVAGWEVPNMFGKRKEWMIGGFVSDIFSGVLGALAALWIYHEYKRGAFAW
jgi:hypothetical protein